MKISLIGAMTQNRVIGKDNDLPWRLPDDMKYFQDTTKNHVVIMGRKNYESLPPSFKPLPNRTNIILTRNSNYKAEGCLIFQDMKDAIACADKMNEHELFIIGGGEIYKESMHLAHKIYLTEIHCELEGDTIFPEIGDNWVEKSRYNHSTDGRHKYSFDFVVYENETLK